MVNSTPDGGVTNESCFKGTDYYIIKKNEGYDFGSWMVGLHKIIPYMDKLEEIILLNDSVFGPLFDMTPLFEKMQKDPCDFWGIVDSYECAYHLQSFFLCFKQRVLRERVLIDFLNQYQFSNDKSNVIQQGEIGITRFLVARGFKPAAAYYSRDLAAKWLDKIGKYIEKLNIFEENQLSAGRQTEFGAMGELTERVQFISSVSRSIRLGTPVNPMHFFWDILLEDGCPYIKRELLFKNVINHPFHFEIINALKERSGYPLEHIYECAVRYGTDKVV